MTLIHFIRLFNRNLKLFIFTSVLLGVLVYLFTMRQPKEFQSETEIYTGLASGVDVTDVNRRTLDFFSASNAFDNLINIIKSRQTLEETGERLLAYHLVFGKIDPLIMSEETFEQLNKWLPVNERRRLTVENDLEATLQLIRDFKRDNQTSTVVSSLFYNQSSPYSHKAINAANVVRVGSSDLIRIDYKWSDPAVCQKTLEILNRVFTGKMGEIKVGQSDDVIVYFRKQVEEAFNRLQAAEDRLKQFRTENRIINYDEQTKSIAIMKESLEDEYQKEVAIKASAEASLEKLEQQLEINKEIVKFSDQILVLRTELSDISAKIALMEVYYQNDEELQLLKTKQAELKAQMSKDLEMRFAYGRTTDGVQIAELLNEWLRYTLTLDESNARLRVFNTRKDYFMDIYDEFSPLGSKIGQMEREIGIEEQNYLQQLHSLNQALLKQKGEAISSGGVVVTVPPFFPLEPLKSRRVFLIMIAFVVGFILPLFAVVILDYLDQTIRTPERATRLTKLNLLGAYPNMEGSMTLKDGTDYSIMSNLGVGLLCQNLLLEVKKLGIQDKPGKQIAFFSTEPGDGKSRVSHEIANELSLLGFQVLVLRYKQSEYDDEILYRQAMFPIDRQYLNARSPEDLLPNGVFFRNFDFVFLEIPAILQSRYPVDVIERMDVAVMVVRATRLWRKADVHALDEISKVFKVKARVALNGVAPDDMEEVIGESSRKQPWLLTFMKRLVTLEFMAKKGFKRQPLF